MVAETPQTPETAEQRGARRDKDMMMLQESLNSLTSNFISLMQHLLYGERCVTPPPRLVEEYMKMLELQGTQESSTDELLPIENSKISLGNR